MSGNKYPTNERLKTSEKDPESRSPETPKDLEAALTLLGKNDDTSRFVGLALLKPVLEQALEDANNTLGESQLALIQRCWKAIPLRFIDGLLKAKANEKRSREEATSMVALAVSVLNAFTALSSSSEIDEKVMSRIPLLKAVLRSCSYETRTEIIRIFHALLMAYPCASTIFGQETQSKDDFEKPDSYLFITMLLIEIRSTFPSLHENLHSAEYEDTSIRLTRCYDLISAFISHLITSLENPSPSNKDKEWTSPLPLSLLLKLRTNISETISLTIEYLRDRYDASIAGAAGLHPSARAPSNPSNSGAETSLTPLPIIWDTTAGIFDDSLILSQLRTSSLWLRDEDNDALRREAANLTDFLLALYQHGGYDERAPPALIALEGTLQVPEGVEAFFEHDGWEILMNDLTRSISQPTKHGLGVDIVNLLRMAIESDAAGPAKEEWMGVVRLALSAMSQATNSSSLDLPIALSELAVDLLSRAPRGLRKRYSGEVFTLCSYINRMLSDHHDLGDENREDLEAVVGSLSSLKI